MEAVHRTVLAGGAPTGVVGRHIVTALENYFNTNGGALTPQGEEDTGDEESAGGEQRTGSDKA